MYKKVYKELIGKLGEGLLEDEFSLEFAEELEQVMRKYEPNKMQELFVKMVNITYQARRAGEIGMVTGERIDKVIDEYEEYCEEVNNEK